MSNGFVNDENRAAHAAAFAIGRASHPAEQANAMSFLLSDESSYMTGTSLANDGGYTDLKLPNYMEVPGTNGTGSGESSL